MVTLSPLLILAAGLAIFAGICMLFKPIIAVYLLVIGTAFDSINVSVGFALLGMGDLAAFALLPVWLAHRLIRLKDLQWPIGTHFLVAYFVLCAASMLVGVEPARGYTTFVRSAFCVVSLFAIVDLIRDSEQLENILLLIAGCAFLHAVFGLSMPMAATGRIGGLENQPNLLGAKIAFGLFPMAALYFRQRGALKRLLISAAVLTMMAAIILTISRGTYIGVLAGILFWLRRSPRLMFLMAAVSALTFFSLDRITENRVERIEKRLAFDGTSVTNRGAVAKNALRVVAQHPVFGVGFGQFTQLDEAIDVTAEAGRGGHSFYLSTAASAGLPALFAFLLFALSQIRQFGANRITLMKDLNRQGPTNERKLWVLNVFQIMLVFHGVHLVVRGSQRWMDWVMFSLYAATAVVIKHSWREREAETDTRRAKSS